MNLAHDITDQFLDADFQYIQWLEGRLKQEHDKREYNYEVK